MAVTQPRILLWDIETTHNLVAAFRLLNQDYIPHENIIQERYIVCASWKWLGERKVDSVSVLDDPARFKKDHTDDRHVVQVLHDKLAEADVIVAHNGDSYDIKYTEGRILFHNLSPLPPITKIDTLKVAKDRFLFNSNRLDYLGRFLKLGKKVKTDNELWLKVLQGDPEAIRQMVVYNKWDVELLDKVFMRLRPYMANYINRHLFTPGGVETCPRCGSKHVKAEEYHRATTQTYRRFVCLDCGGWYRDKTSDKRFRVHTRVL